MTISTNNIRQRTRFNFKWMQQSSYEDLKKTCKKSKSPSEIRLEAKTQRNGAKRRMHNNTGIVQGSQRTHTGESVELNIFISTQSIFIHRKTLVSLEAKPPEKAVAPIVVLQRGQKSLGEASELFSAGHRVRKISSDFLRENREHPMLTKKLWWHRGKVQQLAGNHITGTISYIFFAVKHLNFSVVPPEFPMHSAHVMSQRNNFISHLRPYMPPCTALLEGV